MSIDSIVDPGSLVRDDALNQRVYTDPAVFAAELELLFGRTWIFIGHESEVPHPGDFKTDQIGRWRLLLVRDADRRVRLFHNVCRHRGAMLCHAPGGNTRAFKCMYHGWTFGIDGSLLGVPLREQMRNLNPSSYGLAAVPRVENYQGFIFASMATVGESLKDYLGRAAHYLDLMVERAPEGKIAAIKPVRYFYNGNWKLQIENYSDNYHPAVLHQSALSIGMKLMKEKFGDDVLGARTGGRYMERMLEHGHSIADYQGGRGALWMNAYDDEYLAALAARIGTDRARALRDRDVHLIIYPNLLLHYRMNHYRVIKPVSVDRTVVDVYPCTLVGASKKVNDALILNTSHHCSVGGEVQVDDIQAFSWVQEGLGSQALEWIPLKLHGEDEHLNADGEVESYGTSENAIRHQYREWMRMMSRSRAALSDASAG
ncbi:MAG: Rieske 2Fe-2S domain-containing protein [Candidatus Binataceae bacterium]|nr:Rieske 2Fe-2S domain-containing protein [Candidatus Binataceae bacterium]